MSYAEHEVNLASVDKFDEEKLDTPFVRMIKFLPEAALVVLKVPTCVVANCFCHDCLEMSPRVFQS